MEQSFLMNAGGEKKMHNTDLRQGTLSKLWNQRTEKDSSLELASDTLL